MPENAVSNDHQNALDRRLVKRQVKAQQEPRTGIEGDGEPGAAQIITLAANKMRSDYLHIQLGMIDMNHPEGISKLGMARILVIDDDADMRALLEQTLNSAGYEVALAADGAEGVAQYRTNPADLVITDLYMPNQEGLETITTLRLHYPGIKIVAMSGRTAATAMLGIAQKLGAVEVLHKPFAAVEVLAATCSRKI